MYHGRVGVQAAPQVAVVFYAVDKLGPVCLAGEVAKGLGDVAEAQDAHAADRGQRPVGEREDKGVPGEEGGLC